MAKEFIGNLNSILEQDIALYCDDRIAIIENLDNIEGIETAKIKDFLVLLCLKGKASVYINSSLYTVQPQDMLICHPNVILKHGIKSPDFEFRGICLSFEYLQQLSLIQGYRQWDALLFFEHTPLLSLSPDEVTQFCQYYDLIRSKLTSIPRKHQKQLVNALLEALLYDFADTWERFISLRPQNYTSAENLFQEFIKILAFSYPKKRQVSYYAQQLYVTPKYLSAVCKAVSGATASQLIQRYIIKDIQTLLKSPEKSIKEIVNELEFPSLSFFGRYVRKHLGVSPRQYRHNLKET